MLDRDKLAKILGLLGSDKTGEIVAAAQAADALVRDANTSWAEVLNHSTVADDARGVRTDNEARALFAENETRALHAENERLRETVMQLVVEKQTLREQAARSLTHRIVDGVKQSGQALLALAIAFNGIAFLRRQLAARHRNNQSCNQRVVVHGLLAAGIAVAMGIVASLSLQESAMLGEPSVRSGTMASSGQEALGAVVRSGLPAKAEQRGAISGQPSSATMATPDSVTKSTPSDDALVPVEDMTTLPATLPPTPGETARAAEAPPPVTSPAPEEEPAAPLAPSLTTSPPPLQSPANQGLSGAETAALVARGDTFLSAGDIASARLFYQRAADGGDGGAALRLGATFDPAFLSRTGVRGTPDDPTQASSWYRRAADLGSPTAQEHLQNLEQHRLPIPGSPRPEFHLLRRD
jgi:hypothetical protein